METTTTTPTTRNHDSWKSYARPRRGEVSTFSKSPQGTVNSKSDEENEEDEEDDELIFLEGNEAAYVRQVYNRDSIILSRKKNGQSNFAEMLQQEGGGLGVSRKNDSKEMRRSGSELDLRKIENKAALLRGGTQMVRTSKSSGEGEPSAGEMRQRHSEDAMQHRTAAGQVQRGWVRGQTDMRGCDNARGRPKLGRVISFGRRPTALINTRQSEE